MSRIDATMNALKAQGRKALIPFVTAGYPFADVTPELMHGMVSGGADVIELGVPFSDPSADGPVIQKAGDKALAFGIGLTQVLAMVAEFRKTNTTTPVVLMGYANPVERYDQKHAASFAAGTPGGPFVRDAAAAGVDGVLIVDYPPEECEAFAADLRAHQMDLIFCWHPPAPTRAWRRWPAWPAVMCITCRSRASQVPARSTLTRSKPCCRASVRTSACRWAWALVSATPRPQAPLPAWRMPS